MILFVNGAVIMINHGGISYESKKVVEILEQHT